MTANITFTSLAASDIEVIVVTLYWQHGNILYSLLLAKLHRDGRGSALSKMLFIPCCNITFLFLAYLFSFICKMNWCLSWSLCAWRNNSSNPLMRVADREAWGSRGGIRTGSRQRRWIRLEDTDWSAWTRQHTALILQLERVVRRAARAPRACLWLSLSLPSPFIIQPPVNTPGSRGPQARRIKKWCEVQLLCRFVYKQSRDAKDRHGETKWRKGRVNRSGRVEERGGGAPV